MVNPSHVRPEWRWFWDYATAVIPIWEGGGLPKFFLKGKWLDPTSYNSVSTWTRGRYGQQFLVGSDPTEDAIYIAGVKAEGLITGSQWTLGLINNLNENAWSPTFCYADANYDNRYVTIDSFSQVGGGNGWRRRGEIRYGVNTPGSDNFIQIQSTGGEDLGYHMTLIGGHSTTDHRIYMDGLLVDSEAVLLFTPTWTNFDQIGFRSRGSTLPAGSADVNIALAFILDGIGPDERLAQILMSDPYGPLRVMTRRVIAFPTPEVVEEEEEPPGFVPGEGEVYYKLIKIIGVPA